MGESIQQRGREFLVAGKDGDPFGKREVGRHHRGPSLVAIRDQIEEQLAADAVKGHEAELVNDEDVDPEEALLQPRKLTRVAGFEQLADQIRRAREEDAALLLRRFDAERDRQVRFPRANRAGQDQILRRRDPFAARQRVNLRRADPLDGGEIKRVERLHLREARFAEALPITDSCREASSALRTSCK